MTGRLVTLGEALAVLRGRELWHAESIGLGTGGAEANVAIAAARSGIATTWLGRVGDDALGARILRELRGQGVDAIGIVDANAPTGLLVKELHPGGRTSVAYYRSGSAGSRISRTDLAQVPLGPDAVLHLTGITPALSPSAHDAVLAALDLAERTGARISFDVNHRERLWTGRDADALHRRVAARADLLFTGLDEVGHLIPGWAGGDAETAARVLAETGPRHVVVTAGPAGAVALIDGALHAVSALPVEVVDTVGAGDAFVGAYLAGVIRGDDPDERLRRAALYGAAACRHPGDWEGVVDLSGLEGPGGDPVLR